MQLFVNNQQDKVVIDDALPALLERVVELTLTDSGEQGDVEVAILIVDDDYIRQLNQEYRGLDSSTDVLSFAQRERLEAEPLYDCTAEDDLLGDIVISAETAARQAAAYGHDLEREMAFLTVHGCLHLLGYNHEQEEEQAIMREKEEKILALVDQARA